jgi:hypothetical protein
VAVDVGLRVPPYGVVGAGQDDPELQIRFT